MYKRTAAGRRPIFALALLVAIALAVWGLWPRALEVESGTVIQGPLSVTFVEEGRTRVRHRYVISAPLQGTIERVQLEPGDTVEAGQTVAVLRPTSSALLDPASREQAQAQATAADRQLAAAQASVTAATAEQRRSRAALQRAERLVADQLIARSELDTLRAEASTADASLRAAQARREAARALRQAARAVVALQGAGRGNGATLPLRAPIGGTVLQRHVESAGPIAAGQPVLEIGDLGELEVVVEALTADAVRVSPGSPVQLLRWGGATALDGHVRTIEPGGFTKISALGVEEQRTLIVVSIDASAAARNSLGDGYRVEARFLVWHSPETLTVPTAALFRDGTAWAVYAIDNGRARLRRLELGMIGDDAAQVLAGVTDGTRVVLYPGDAIGEGVRVESPDPGRSGQVSTTDPDIP